MPVDGAQPVNTHLLSELMKHSRCGINTAQPGESPPSRLFRKLGHHEIERMGGGQKSQQVNPPQLRGTQRMATTAGEIPGAEAGDKIIRHITAHAFKQKIGADRRQNIAHAGTLTQTRLQDTPLVSA
jgi:hypothetical protein